MLFEVSPGQVENLSSERLVQLLRRLLYAEAQLAAISPRGVSVPLQISIPDGGEDARIEWENGQEKTNFLPGRFTILQSKATSLSQSEWKKEVWTKKSQKEGPPELNAAITTALRNHGSYIGFTTAPLVGVEADKRIEAIKNGIIEAGGTPSDLIAVDIFDANKIAAWATSHPAVALWLNEELSGVATGGFQTIDGWQTLADLSSTPLVADSAQRFHIRRHTEPENDDGGGNTSNGVTALQAGERIVDQLLQPKQMVRIFGPSGVGKSRFALELLKTKGSVLREAAALSAVYCDYRAVGTQLPQVALRFAQSGFPATLIVDECPPKVATQLLDAVTSEGSALRVVTIGLEDKLVRSPKCLNIEVGPGDTALIEGMVRARLPTASDSDVAYIQNLCDGYPRIAVLATESYGQRGSVLASIEDVVERILSGSGVEAPEDVRAVEVLALFERLGADEDVAAQLDFVANRLLESSGDRMYESLARASNHIIVDRRGRYFAAQPKPIAAFLGVRRLGLLRINTLIKFVDDADVDLLTPFFRAWRRFDTSQTAVRVAEQLLSRDGKYGTRASLETEHGADVLDALVHVAPDSAADTLVRVFGEATIDDLESLKAGRRGVVRALEKLVFRSASFTRSARLLMKLGAAENENWGNNATGQFVQLFQLRLSGTEVPPGERFGVLDEGLAHGDSRLISLCVDALEKTLESRHASRSGGSEEIGSRPPLRDWEPTLRKEIFDFHREGIRRLVEVAHAHSEFATRCLSTVASHIRGMLHPSLLADLEATITEITKIDYIWMDVVKSIGDWLYYDSSKGAPTDFVQKVKALYERLIPDDLVLKALLYAKFWSADIHDPDTTYSQGSSDFSYSTRKATELAVEIAKDATLTERAVRAMSTDEFHNSFPFAQELAKRVDDAVATFQLSLGVIEGTGNTKGLQFLCGFLNGMDTRDSNAADRCIEIARMSEALKGQEVRLRASVPITPARIPGIAASLKSGAIGARDYVSFSYGRGLDAIPADLLEPLLEELRTQGPAGMWSALEVVSMYQMDRPTLHPLLEALIKRISVDPAVIRDSRDDTRDGFVLEQCVELLVKNNRVDDEFAAELSQQIVRLCQTDGYLLFHNLDDAARKIVSKLADIRPSQLWALISRFYEIASPEERNYLGELVGPDRLGFDGAGHLTAGVLFKVPEGEMLDWARGDAENRVGFLCTFYPVFTFRDEKLEKWHPAMERLAEEFGRVQAFRDALEHRLEPTSWWGSLVPLLQPYLAQLDSWSKHRIPQLANWAKEERRRIEQRIEWAKRLEAED